MVSLHTSPTAAIGQGSNRGLNVYVREVCRRLSHRDVATDVFTRGWLFTLSLPLIATTIWLVRRSAA